MTAPVMVALLLASGAPTGQPLAEQAASKDEIGQPEHQDWAEEIANAAALTGLSELLIRRVMDAESAGVANAVSPKGAMGLMQLMPETYRQIAADLGLRADPFNPRDNVLAGAVFLEKMLDRFGSPAFLAAYNAGPQCMEEVLAGLRPLPDESRIFMDKVAAKLGLADGGSVLGSSRLSRGITGSGGLFFVSRHDGFAAGQSVPGQSIFVPLGAQSLGP